MIPSCLKSLKLNNRDGGNNNFKVIWCLDISKPQTAVKPVLGVAQENPFPILNMLSINAVSSSSYWRLNGAMAHPSNAAMYGTTGVLSSRTTWQARGAGSWLHSPHHTPQVVPLDFFKELSILLLPIPSGSMNLVSHSWNWTYSFGGQSTKTGGELDKYTIVLDALHKTNKQHSSMDFWEAVGILTAFYRGNQGWLPAKELAVGTLSRNVPKRSEEMSNSPIFFFTYIICYFNESVCVQTRSKITQRLEAAKFLNTTYLMNQWLWWGGAWPSVSASPPGTSDAH